MMNGNSGYINSLFFRHNLSCMYTVVNSNKHSRFVYVITENADSLKSESGFGA